MRLEERKQKFTKLLEDLLEERGGVKGKLAQELAISPARFSNWLQGKVDPAALDLVSFKQIATLKGCSIDRLVEILGLIEEEQNSLARFRKLLSELLLNLTQEELADRLGINQGTISRWLSLEKPVDLKKISVTIMFGLAREKKWTLEKLFAYLKLESNQKTNNNEPLNNYQNVKQQNAILKHSFLIILEQKDLAIGNVDLNFAQRATNYSSNLVHHLQLQPDNIQVASIENLPESLEEFDLLIFEVSSPDSPNIALIKEISFDGDIVVFVSENLPENVRAGLEDRVTDVLVKPIDWTSLKDKEYFR